MYIKEAIQKVFNCSNLFQKHLTLFSICGTIGVLDAYVAFNGLETLGVYTKIGYCALWIVYLLFYTGYETLFLHERELPEIDLRSLKIVFTKTLFSVFLIELVIFAIRLVYENTTVILLSDILLAVPLIAIQAGFAKELKNEDAFSLFENITLNKIFNLILKRVLLFISSYALGLFVLIVGFIGLFLGIFIASKGSLEVVIYSLLAQKHILMKLSLFSAGIVLEYIMTTITLVWDYEALKILEQK